MENDSTLDLSGTERVDGYNREQQLGRRMEAWLDDLTLSGALSPSERRDIHLAVGPGCWQWAAVDTVKADLTKEIERLRAVLTEIREMDISGDDPYHSSASAVQAIAQGALDAEWRP